MTRPLPLSAAPLRFALCGALSLLVAACGQCGEPDAPVVDRPDLGAAAEGSEPAAAVAAEEDAPAVEPTLFEGSAVGEGSAFPQEPFVFDPLTASLDVLLERGSWAQIQARRPALSAEDDARVVAWIQGNISYYADPIFEAMAAATPEGSGAPPLDDALLMSEFVLLVWQSDDPRRAERCLGVVDALLPHEPMTLAEGRIHDPIQEAVTGCLDFLRQAGGCEPAITDALTGHLSDASDNVFLQSLAWYRRCAADDDAVRDALRAQLRVMDRAARDGATLTIGLMPAAVAPFGIDADDYPRLFAP